MANRENNVAQVEAVIAAIGLIMIIGANRMYAMAAETYLSTDMTYIECVSEVVWIDAIWTSGIVFVAASIIVVAMSVPASSSPSIEKLKQRLTNDFYRRCPTCAAWTTKIAPYCSSCHAQLPGPAEFAPFIPPSPKVKEGP